MKRDWPPASPRARPKPRQPREPQEAVEPLQEPQQQRAPRELELQEQQQEQRRPQAPHELRAPEERRVPQQPRAPEEPPAPDEPRVPAAPRQPRLQDSLVRPQRRRPQEHGRLAARWGRPWPLADRSDPCPLRTAPPLVRCSTAGSRLALRGLRPARQAARRSQCSRGRRACARWRTRYRHQTPRNAYFSQPRRNGGRPPVPCARRRPGTAQSAEVSSCMSRESCNNSLSALGSTCRVRSAKSTCVNMPE